MSNKVKFNLRSVYYSKLTNSAGNDTYSTPVAIPGAVALTLAPKGNTTPFYADGIEYFTSVVNGGYEGDLEIALLPESFLTDILGEELTSTDKVLLEKASSVTTLFALLFEFEGDVKATRHVMYNCVATRPEIASKTTTDSTEPTTDKLTIKCRPDSAGRVKARTSDTTTESVYSGWFKTVWTPTVV